METIQKKKRKKKKANTDQMIFIGDLTKKIF